MHCLGHIYENAYEFGFNEDFFTKYREELAVISKYFQTTDRQSLFIALIFISGYKSEMVTLQYMIDYIQCNPIKILQYSTEFEELFTKGILYKKQRRRKTKIGGAGDRIFISEKACDALLQGKPLPDNLQLEKEPEDDLGVLGHMHKLCMDRHLEEIDYDELFEQVNITLANCSKFPLIEQVLRRNLGLEGTFLFLCMAWNTTTGNSTIHIQSFAESVFEDYHAKIGFLRSMVNGSHILIREKLLEILPAQFINDTEMMLTNEARQLLKQYNIEPISMEIDNPNIVKPEKIAGKTLLYSDKEKEPLSLLQKLLQQENLQKTQENLAAKAFPKGITVLLHGAPGTGKTEIVKQIAKETGRAIMPVDLSQAKSKWYGESEKIVKKIFTDYREFAGKCEVLPILLFNEADGLISKRTLDVERSTDQTSNTIQNILLEELENFEGILIATTNLVMNMDAAFERRFLFKILFNKPDTHIVKGIWALKLPGLDEKDYERLAREFQFSGGQIDNIARKKEIHEIIYNEAAGFDKIHSFCQEENFHNKPVSIGF